MSTDKVQVSGQQDNPANLVTWLLKSICVKKFVERLPRSQTVWERDYISLLVLLAPRHVTTGHCGESA